MAISPEVAKARASVAAYVSHHPDQPELADDARRELKTLKLADSIRRVVGSVPVPTQSQLAMLRDLLVSGGGGNER
ncbi:hypothetical protein [Streptomyces sviceus]|uniref:hypothetical protein n=1 Tax=Streptomyces sviceus TaxID=285530 RepID=UPI0036E81FC1